MNAADLDDVIAKLGDRETEVLGGLVSCWRYYQKREWDLPIKPMDVGGSNGSHHSYTLTKLVRLGLAEHRKAGCDWGVASTRYRGSKAYRPTDLGSAVVDYLKERKAA